MQRFIVPKSMGRNITVRELVSIVDTKMLDAVAASTDLNFQVKSLVVRLFQIIAISNFR